MTNQNNGEQELATSCPYNTRERGQVDDKKKPTTKFRWAFIEIANSLTKFYNDIAEELKKAKFRYYLAAWHRMDTEKGDHIHIFVQWDYPKEQGPNFLRKIYFAHVSPHENYNPTAMISYIKCEDEKHINAGIKAEIIEETGMAKSNGKFPSIAEVRAMNKEQRDQLGIQYKNINKELDERDIKRKMYADKIHHRRKQVEVSWFYGLGGSGKTEEGYYALEEYEDKEGGIISFDNTGKATLDNTELDTNDIKILFINEFRDSQINLADFLSYLLNEKPMRKMYGYYYFPNLEKIVISSSQDPYYIYRNKRENRKQIYRRLTNIYRMEGEFDFETGEPEFINTWGGKEYFEKYDEISKGFNEEIQREILNDMFKFA